MNCKECNGDKKIINPDWEEYADRLYDNGSAGSYAIACDWASRKFDKYIPCPFCKDKEN